MVGDKRGDSCSETKGRDPADQRSHVEFRAAFDARVSRLGLFPCTSLFLASTVDSASNASHPFYLPPTLLSGPLDIL